MLARPAPCAAIRAEAHPSATATSSSRVRRLNDPQITRKPASICSLELPSAAAARWSAPQASLSPVTSYCREDAPRSRRSTNTSGFDGGAAPSEEEPQYSWVDWANWGLDRTKSASTPARWKKLLEQKDKWGTETVMGTT